MQCGYVSIFRPSFPLAQIFKSRKVSSACLSTSKVRVNARTYGIPPCSGRSYIHLVRGGRGWHSSCRFGIIQNKMSQTSGWPRPSSPTLSLFLKCRQMLPPVFKCRLTTFSTTSRTPRSPSPPTNVATSECRHLKCRDLTFAGYIPSKGK